MKQSKIILKGDSKMAGNFNFKTVDEIWEKMEESFLADRAGNMSAVYQYDITGGDGGKWFCKIENKTCKFEKGEHDSPDATIIVGAKDWIAINNGTTSGMKAMMTGKLKVKGNMALAMKLEKLFE